MTIRALKLTENQGNKRAHILSPIGLSRRKLTSPNVQTTKQENPQSKIRSSSTPYFLFRISLAAQTLYDALRFQKASYKECVVAGGSLGAELMLVFFVLLLDRP